MTTRPIERTGRVECIACNAWVLPNERLRAAFVGGHNVRFYVCLACIDKYKQGHACGQCGEPLNNENIELSRRRGKIRARMSYCLECKAAKDVQEYKARQRRKLSQRLKNAVR